MGGTVLMVGTIQRLRPVTALLAMLAAALAYTAFTLAGIWRSAFNIEGTP